MKLISYLHRKNYNYIPGAQTVSEIMYLLQNDYTIIKFIMRPPILEYSKVQIL